MKTKPTVAFILLALLASLNPGASSAFAQGTMFTYQGLLNDGTNPATGTNFSMVFYLYDAPTGGNLLANEGIASVTVSNGLFTVPLDFSNVFDGTPRWLEVTVEKTGPGGDSGFTTLSPRQQITPAPYAIFANTASNVSGTISSSQLSGPIAATNISGTLGPAQLPAGVLTNGASGVNISGTFSGNGSNITGVNLLNINTEGAINIAKSIGNFVTATNLAANGSPLAVAAGDIFGNGKVDIVCVNAAGELLPFINNGSDGFTLLYYLGVGAEPESIALADVNGDGILDFICANATANQLSVFTNNASGGVTGFVLNVGTTPVSVIAADVNGDGRLDLICANSGDNTLTVLTNNGSGGFAIASSPSVGNQPRGLTAADVNGDGHIDLISANYGANTLTVLTNNGSGGFAIASSPVVGSQPVSVTAADVNGDGHIDLICANNGGNTLTVLTNNCGGGFAVASSPAVGSQPASVTAADVNSDGYIDLICANNGVNTLTVMTNNGSGGFALASLPVVGSHPICVVAADINGDGKVDLISANESNATVTVLTNTTLFPATFTGNGSGLTNLPATLTGTFIGNGNGLTNLKTSSLVGTLAAANFAATVITNFPEVNGPLPANFFFTSHGGRLLITPIGSGWTSSGGQTIGMTVELDGGAPIITNHIYANLGSDHVPFEARTVVTTNVPTGSHQITFTALPNTTTDAQDYFSVTVQELPY